MKKAERLATQSILIAELRLVEEQHAATLKEQRGTASNAAAHSEPEFDHGATHVSRASPGSACFLTCIFTIAWGFLSLGIQDKRDERMSLYVATIVSMTSALLGAIGAPLLVGATLAEKESDMEATSESLLSGARAPRIGTWTRTTLQALTGLSRGWRANVTLWDTTGQGWGTPAIAARRLLVITQLGSVVGALIFVVKFMLIVRGGEVLSWDETGTLLLSMRVVFVCHVLPRRLLADFEGSRHSAGYLQHFEEDP